MSYRTLGTCSICGGPVTVPLTWMGIHPPTPTCLQCGAIPQNPHGPRIEMQPGPRPYTQDKQVLRGLFRQPYVVSTRRGAALTALWSR